MLIFATALAVFVLFQASGIQPTEGGMGSQAIMTVSAAVWH